MQLTQVVKVAMEGWSWSTSVRKYGEAVLLPNRLTEVSNCWINIRRWSTVSDSSDNRTPSTSNPQPSEVPADLELEEDDESNDREETQETDHETSSDTADQVTIREFLDEKLKNYRQDKMKRKLPVDAQILGCAQEELAIKRRLVEQVNKMDQKYADTMDKMSQNMEKLTNSIADGFVLLKQMMAYQQPGTMYQPQPYRSYIQESPNSFAPRMPPGYPSSSHGFTPNQSDEHHFNSIEDQ